VTDAPPVRRIARWLVLGALLAGGILVAASLWPASSKRVFQVASGLLALALVAGSATYGARKWMLITRLGSLHTWMVGHVALGVALGGVVAAHADLADLGGPGWALVGLIALQVGSGVWALAELSWTPKRFASLPAGALAFPTTARRRLETIPGTVPTLRGEIAPGCRFAPRCPFVKSVCTEKDPVLKEVKPGHKVSCWLY